MMKTMKYDHLIKPLGIGATSSEDAKEWIGPGNAKQEIRLNGRDHLEGINLALSWGVHTGTGDWHAGLDPHVHPYPEILLFAGLDTANVNYLGAEIDCCLGPEQETYTFNDPTVIVIPAGLPHGPISTKRMFSPRGIGFWTIELNSSTELTWLGQAVSGISADRRKSMLAGLKFASPENILHGKPAQPTGKYANLVKPLRSGVIFERGEYSRKRFALEQLAAYREQEEKTGAKPGPGSPGNMAGLGGKDLEGLNASFFWGFCSRPGLWRRGTGSHVHASDEVLIYVGTDPDHPENLGGEIEIEMGEEHERHLINQPSVVICPAGFSHTPQLTRWVDRPFAFFAIKLSGECNIEAYD